MTSNKEIIIKNVIMAETIFQKIRGLLGKKNISPLLFETRFGIHTFGMKHAIDIVILDKKNIVRKIKSSLNPNRLFFWNPHYFRVLELPSGTVKVKKIIIGAKIIFENSSYSPVGEIP
jgi:uncharacterized membrane protein (UPF0127 family)